MAPTVSGKKVEVDTGRDLHIQSLQDVDNFKEHKVSLLGSQYPLNQRLKTSWGVLAVVLDELIANGKVLQNRQVFRLEMRVILLILVIKLNLKVLSFQAKLKE